MKIVFDNAASKVLVRHPERAKLQAKIGQLASDPASLANNITRLKGQPESRLRVGDVRIIFRIEDDTVFIEAIGPRGGIYD